MAAPAKVNLYLRIVGRRPDGYHLLDSVMVPIDLADELLIEARPDRRTTIRVAADDPTLPGGRANLAYAAAAAVLSATGLRAHVNIYIRKRVPVAAGLGGGSSDAAAVLRALTRALCIPLPAPELGRLGATLGADVPFFVRGVPARVAGAGEKVSPWRGRVPAWIVIVVPRFGVRAAWAYGQARRSLTNAGAGHRMRGFWGVGVPAAVNDLEDFVFRRHPELAELKRALQRAGAASALMAGSGSAIFGTFRNRAAARRAAGRFAGSGGLRVFVCRPRARPPHVVAIEAGVPHRGGGR